MKPVYVPAGYDPINEEFPLTGPSCLGYLLYGLGAVGALMIIFVGIMITHPAAARPLPTLANISMALTLSGTQQGTRPATRAATMQATLRATMPVTMVATFAGTTSATIEATDTATSTPTKLPTYPPTR